MKLERKIQNLMLIVSIPIIFMIIIFTYLLSLQSHYDGIKKESGQLITAIHQDIQSDIDELTTLVIQLSEMDLLKIPSANFTNYLNTTEENFVFTPSPDEKTIIQFFYTLMESNLYINSVYLAREDGSFVRSHPRGKNTQYDPRERAWYQAAIANPKEVVITEPYRSLTTEDINIGFEKALLDDNGTIIGVVGLDITLENLSKYTNSLFLSLDSALEIIYNQELVIASNRADRLMQEPYYELGSYAVELSETGKKESYLSFSETFENSLLSFVILVPRQDLYLASFIARKEVILLLFLLLIALIITNFYTIKTNIIHPMNQLVLQIQESSGSSLQFDSGIAEFEQLTRSFNHLLKEITSVNGRLLHSKNIVIRSLANLSEGRDAATGNHIYRVQVLTNLLLLRLVENHSFPEILSPDYINLVTECSPLHDIGKVAIPDAILLKPGSLSREEFEEIKLHTVYGYRALNAFDSDPESGENYEVDDLYISIAKEIVLYHHERYDGSGYPKGLKGNEIPLCAQIVGIVDVYEALTSQRIYKPPYSHEEAMEIILVKEKSKYNPLLLTALVDCAEEFQEVKSLNVTTYNS